MHIWDLLRRARFHCDEVHGLPAVTAWRNNTGNVWQNEDLIEAMNDAQRFYLTAAINYNPAFWIEHTLLSLVADQEAYDLPAGAERLIAADLENESAAPIFDVPIAMRYQFKSSTYSPYNLYGVRGWRALDRDQIRYLPAPTAAVVNGLRVWYVPVIPRVHYGLAASGTSTSLVGATDANVYGGQIRGSWDDYFVGCHITIISGTGIDQRRRVSDYTASSRTFTLDSALGTALDGTSIYQIDPIMPETYQELLSLRAAHAALAAKGMDTRGVDGLMRQVESAWESYIANLAGGGPHIMDSPSALLEQVF